MTIEQLIRQIVREEIANANRSVQQSPAGIAARDQGDLECDEVAQEKKSMAHTHTDSDGDSSSLQETVAEALSRLRRNRKPSDSPQRRAGKSKAAP